MQEAAAANGFEMWYVATNTPRPAFPTELYGTGTKDTGTKDTLELYRSAPGLRLLSRPPFRPARGRAGVSLGLDGCEVRLCDPCARVRLCVPCVSRVCPGSPGVFLPVEYRLGSDLRTP